MRSVDGRLRRLEATKPAGIILETVIDGQVQRMTTQQFVNITMQRIIGKYAKTAAEEVSEKYGQSDRVAAELRGVAHEGNANSGREQLDAFAVLFDAFKRTMNNPAMIPHWDELTGAIVEGF